jgi:hypothetical protein
LYDFRRKIMQITKSQLQQIIREEYLRVTPAAAGTLMTEARANYLAEQVLDEGLWDSIKAGFAGLKAGAGAAGGKLGDAAGKALAPAVAAVKSAGAAAAKAAGDVSNFVGQIKDEALKAAATAAQDSFRASLRADVQKALATGIKQLVSAGMSEDEATSLASTILTSELMGIAGLGGGK